MHWGAAPRGPTYTIVIDANGMGWHHFGRAARAGLADLTHVFTHYYPDFVGQTLVVNAPRFIQAAWGFVSRFMPAWWGVKLGSMHELEQQPGWLEG
jgi:hypothetical protein